MADIKSTIKNTMDSKPLVDRITVFNNTQDALDQYSRVVFSNYALLLGDMAIEEDHKRPIGFLKRKILLELVVLIKDPRGPHTELEVKLSDIAKQLNQEYPKEDDEVNMARVLNWTAETKLNDNVNYIIGTLEIWQFLTN